MSDRFHVATRKGLFTFKRASASDWKIERSDFLGDNVSMVMEDPRDGTALAVLNHGHFGIKFHRLKKGATAWEEITAPAYPPKPEDVEDIDPMRRTSVPWSVQDVWALMPGGSDEPGVIWCGTMPGGLFKSTDGGDSWAMIQSLWEMPDRKKWMGGGADLASIHSILVDPRDSKHVTIGVSVGGVWTTRDGGETWKVASHGMRADYVPDPMDPITQDPHIVVQCRSNPDAMWTQHHNGIFRTVDGCKSWTEITNVKPSVFGFTAAVHPNEPDTAWFVPGIKDEKRIPVDGKLVVTRTRDGGKTFDVLSKGLPQENAYDLVFRHGLDIDETGDRLAFGSTTGNLWVSENQGDSWQQLSCTLPPIYAVKFAR